MNPLAPIEQSEGSAPARSLTGRIARKGTLFVGGFVAALFILSFIFPISWSTGAHWNWGSKKHNEWGPGSAVMLAGGTILIATPHSGLYYLHNAEGEFEEPGWRIGLGVSWDYLPYFFKTWWPLISQTAYSASVNQITTTIALWPPLLAFGIPSLILWRQRRRFLPGHCRSCGYNLTGNVSGHCPECGQTIGISDQP